VVSGTQKEMYLSLFLVPATLSLYLILQGFRAQTHTVNRVWEIIRVSIKISAKESLGHYELK
jgi:hypothetical protein